MELLWAALPMAGCALVMVLMMRVMAGGHGSQPPTDPDPTTTDRRGAPEAQIQAPRAQSEEKRPS